MFGSIGRFAIRYRWVVVLGWLGVTAAAVIALPSLSSVIRNDNTAFLPNTAPSIEAAHLAAPFLLGGQLSGTIVADRQGGPAPPSPINRLSGASRTELDRHPT